MARCGGMCRLAHSCALDFFQAASASAFGVAVEVEAAGLDSAALKVVSGSEVTASIKAPRVIDRIIYFVPLPKTRRTS